MLLARIIEDIARHDGARILAGLIGLSGDFDTAEEALQEAYARALDTWPRNGPPEVPAAWINTVSRRIVIDQFRKNRFSELPEDIAIPAAPEFDDDVPGIEDDRLRLMFTCCHPALSRQASCALALKTLGGLTTRQIARGFLEAESATAQRIVRAKRKIRDARIPFEVPDQKKLPERLGTVLSIIYLIFNEGYVSTDSDSLIRPDLAAEGIRLAKLAVELMPNEAEALGLLALLLLTDARRTARLSEEGELVPLEDQNRSHWNHSQIQEGLLVLDRAIKFHASGSYQVQAAIAALHAGAPSARETDWKQIALLYRRLLEQWPTPVIELNAAVAFGMATSFETALAWIERLELEGKLADFHPLYSAKGEMLRRIGKPSMAAESYRQALLLATNSAEKRYLIKRIEECKSASRTVVELIAGP